MTGSSTLMVGLNLVEKMSKIRGGGKVFTRRPRMQCFKKVFKAIWEIRLSPNIDAESFLDFFFNAVL